MRLNLTGRVVRVLSEESIGGGASATVTINLEGKAGVLVLTPPADAPRFTVGDSVTLVVGQIGGAS